MNPNDLPLTQKLAALIEAGRACNPNAPHLRGKWGKGDEGGCAMRFAFKAAGIPVAVSDGGINWQGLAEHLGTTTEQVLDIGKRVISMNDNTTSTLPEIVEAIRCDRLPEAKSYFAQPLAGFIYVSLDEAQELFQPALKVSGFGDYKSAWEKTIKAPAAKPQPAKKVRASAKTGATWPTPKHCYA